MQPQPPFEAAARAAAKPGATARAAAGTGTAARRLTRRAWLKRVGIAALAGVAGGSAYARWVEPFWPELVELDMPLPGLGPALVGKRIAHLSDLHVSDIVPLAYLIDALEQCLARKPDLILLTGDYVTNATRRALPDLKTWISRIHAPLGVFASLGNHDYHENCNHRHGCDAGSGEIARQIGELLERAGVRVLRNQLAQITLDDARLQIAGLEDLWSGYYEPAAAFQHARPELPCIALSHNPDTIDDLQHLPCHWILSGHTHGGQISLPGLGPPILPVVHRELAAGLFERNGRQLYVNRGLGFIRPLRFACRPEMVEFTLIRA